MDKRLTPSALSGRQDVDPGEQLNELFTTVFNDILKIEEASLRTSLNQKISVTEIHTLDAISASASGTMSEVAAALRITISTLTVSVNRLEKKQLVQRRRGVSDRRVVYVSLSQEGRRLVEAHRRFHRRMIQSVAQNLNDEDLRLTLQAIGRLKDFFHREAKKLDTLTPSQQP
ncbi:MAG: MarR family transcriptional regulator [Clostridiales bacterium]|nr:MarR family transcriptional regulator [Clostridiales bacterium]